MTSSSPAVCSTILKPLESYLLGYLTYLAVLWAARYNVRAALALIPVLRHVHALNSVTRIFHRFQLLYILSDTRLSAKSRYQQIGELCLNLLDKWSH